MKSKRIGNVEVVRYEDDLEDTLISSKHLSECIKLINTQNFTCVSIGGSYERPEIDFLKECPDINNLTINSKAVRDFTGLGYLTNLKVLVLNLEKKVEIDLGNLGSLEEFYGELPPSTKGLAGLEKLSKMEIWGYKPRSKSLQELGEIVNLKELKLTQSSIADLIDRMKYLNKLELYYMRQLKDISSLKALGKSLKELYLENCKTIEDYTPVGSLVNLTSLQFLTCGNIKSLAFIKNLPNLNFLDFEETNIIDGDISYCKGIDKLYFTDKKHYSHRKKGFQMNENFIKGDTNMTLAELKKNKPTEEWKERMDEDDDLFTEENIVASEKALDQYLQELEKLKIGNEAEITASVKKVVLKFNELNEEYDYFIETMEREELCEFILEAAQMCGLKIEDDITEEWREW